MLSPSEIEQYHRDGYVIPDYRLQMDTIESIRRDHSRFVERHPQFEDYCPALFVYDMTFLNYARNDEILDMVEQLIGPNIALWNSSFFAKPAKVGSRTPWHQDGEYWLMRPLATCSVWIAVDESTEENGCLQVIPGSHRGRSLSKHHTNSAQGLALPLELDSDQFDESKSVNITLEPGQISLHDVFLMHASEPNRSPNPRRGMTLRYMPTSSVYRRDLQGSRIPVIEEKRTLFLMRGIDESGENDFRVRGL